ncbi:MAG: ABC transporter permease subunit [Emcibacteraceae bacterium]|nr:ABC transporter permease subunit [Emcibacteraceae bacterium]
MEKAYNSKLTLGLLLILIALSPFGIFIYAFINVFVESVSTISTETLNYITPKDLIFSITTSIISASLAILIGSSLCLHFIRTNKHNFNYGILNVVLVLPHLAFAYIVYLFFSDQGFLYRLFELVNFPIDFSIINDRYGIGIILNYTLKETPFVLLYLLATQKKEMQNHILTAKDLGASFSEIYLKVFLPLNIVQITTIAIVVFAFALGNYEVPFVLGANSPHFLSVSALENFQSIDMEQNAASYIKVSLIFLIALTASIVLRLYARRFKC